MLCLVPPLVRVNAYGFQSTWDDMMDPRIELLFSLAIYIWMGGVVWGGRKPAVTLGKVYEIVVSKLEDWGEVSEDTDWFRRRTGVSKAGFQFWDLKLSSATKEGFQNIRVFSQSSTDWSI